MGWKLVPPEESLCVAVADFQKQHPHHLDGVRLGTLLEITEECEDWYYGRHDDSQTNVKGIFPKNHVKLKKCKTIKRNNAVVVEVDEDPVAHEIAGVVKDWHVELIKLHKHRNIDKFKQMRELMMELIKIRQQILGDFLPEDHLNDLKLRTTEKIDIGNRELGLDMVPRDLETGEVVGPASSRISADGQNIPWSIMELHKVHEQQAMIGRSQALGGPRRVSSMIASEHKKIGAQHLYLHHKTFACNVGEETVVTYTLYDATHAQDFVSESYIVRLSKQGTPVDIAAINEMCCVFTDIKSETDGALYLVAMVNREGQIDAPGGSRLPVGSARRTAALRRPVAVGVLPLQEFIGSTQEDTDVEFTMQLFKSEEDVFPELYRYIILNETDRYQVMERGGGNILISCRTMTGDFTQVKKKNPLLLKKETAIAKRRGFPEIIKPEDVRNDLYITVDQAVFNKGEKKAERNIEVTMRVVNEKGKVVPKAIVPGASSPGTIWPEYWTSMIYYHNNMPKWLETVKLNLEPDQVSKCHLKFTFKHCSSTDKHEKKDIVFAYSFTRLVNPATGTLLKDELHQLPVYKWTAKHDKNYLDPNNGALKTQETFNIKSLSCSTKITQEPMLFNLIKWESKVSMLPAILDEVKQLKGTEIIKHLRAVFDALFKILDTKDTKDQYSGKVFDVLVHICSELAAPRFYDYRPVLNRYVQKHMTSKSSFQYIIADLQNAIENRARSDDPAEKLLVRKMMTALELIFNFAYQSRKLFNKAFKIKNANDNGFREKMSRLLKAFNNFVADPTKDLFPTQQPCVKNFSKAFAGMSSFFTPTEISNFATDFLKSIPATTEGSTSFATAKLKYLDSIVQSTLFRTSEGRASVLPKVLESLAATMPMSSHISATLTVLGDILTHLEAASEEERYLDVLNVVKQMLQPMFDQCEDEVETIERANKTEASKPFGRRSAMSKEKGSDGKFFPCLLGLLRLMKPQHYMDYVKDMAESTRLKFVNFTLETFLAMVTKDIFPKDWMVMVMLKNDVLLASIDSISTVLNEYFVLGPKFNQPLLRTYFALSSGYICQDSLQLESFTENKRKKILNEGPDRRVEMAKVLVQQFKKIETPNNVKFVEDKVEGSSSRKLIQSIQQAALVPADGVRDLLIPVFFDLIDSEVRKNQDFDTFQRDLITELDQSVSSGFGDKPYRWKYMKIMKQLCEESDHADVMVKGQPFNEALAKFNDAVDNLLTQLLALRHVPDGQNYNDMRAGYIYKLLKFYEENNRPQLQLKYIYILSDLHADMKNYAEAGFTLMLHAALLEFSDKELPAIVDSGKERYPAQKERERKIQLYGKMVDLFDKGMTWEKAILYAKELADEYENEMNYKALCSIHRKIADLFEKISAGNRVLPQYFKVGYYGVPFPHGYRNVAYVYRSKDKNTHIKEFCDTIQNQFPTAQILMKDSDPTEEMRSSPEMVIMISKITPNMDAEKIAHRYPGKILTSAVKTYFENNEVQEFKYARPYREGPKTDNEFENLWTAHYSLKTASAMPSMLAKSEIIELTRKNVDPLDNAINAMETKNKELQGEIEQKNSNPTISINPLTMALNGVLDAAVMGGTDMYRKAFFTDEYMDAHPEMIVKIDKLSSLMDQQVTILELGVMVHGKYCPKDLQPLQKRLESILEGMKGKSKDDKMSRRGSSTSIVSTKSLPATEMSADKSQTPNSKFTRAQSSMAVKGSGSSHTLGTKAGGSMKIVARVNNPKNPFDKTSTTGTSLKVPGNSDAVSRLSKANASAANPLNPFPEDDVDEPNQASPTTPLRLNEGFGGLSPPSAHEKTPLPDNDIKSKPKPTPVAIKDESKNPFGGGDSPTTAPKIPPKKKSDAPPPIPAKTTSGPAVVAPKKKVNPFDKSVTSPPPLAPKVVKPPARPSSKKPMMPEVTKGAAPAIPLKKKVSKNPFAAADDRTTPKKKNPFAPA